MTIQEIEDEKREILERFGAGIASVLEKAKQNRMKRASETKHRVTGAASPPPPAIDVDDAKQSLQNLPEVPISPEERPVERARSPPPSAMASLPTSRPSSRSSRRLRFAELEPQDVYVYESHPPSPKRTALALPAPTKDDKDAVSLGTWHGKLVAPPPSVPDTDVVPNSSPTDDVMGEPDATAPPQNTDTPSAEPDEGTPEYIRRRYFPDVPANDPNLAWMSQSNASSADESHSSSVRFDLQGTPIPPALASQLPTSLGLHHHAEGTHAGYTLDDVFLLSRSTVPSQRMVMFGVLSGITRLLCKLQKGENVPDMDEFVGKEEELRKRIVAAGVEALNEKGSVGLRAIEVVWECVVGWDAEIIAMGMQGIWLESAEADAIRSLSLEFVLASISDMINLNLEAYPHEALTRVMQIVQRLALENENSAKEIVEAHKLLSGIVRYFLLTPYAQENVQHAPNPEVIDLLVFLSKTSRDVAHSLAQSFSDDILRFLTILPESSPLPAPLASALMVRSMSFFTSLGTYGLCTGLASAAMEHVGRVANYATSSPSAPLALSLAWARLAEVWVTCSVDPHVTTPPHDITWSRTSAWGWQTELIGMLDRVDTSGSYWSLWGGVWGVAAAWLEGCRVNCVRAGEQEREVLLQYVQRAFAQGGKACAVLSLALDALESTLQVKEFPPQSQMKSIASACDILRNAVRLWLAFMPSHSEGPPASPPFNLPYDRISSVAALLLSHPVWRTAEASSQQRPAQQRYAAVHLRHLTAFLSQYLSLSRRLPAVTKELWLAQAFSVILRFMPGDEDAALAVIGNVLTLFPSVEEPQWKQAAHVLEPFMRNAVLSKVKEVEKGEDEIVEDTPRNPRTRLGPLTLTPASIATTTTCVLVSPFAGPKSRRHFSGLPLDKDWALCSMDHLLHSADSVVFKNLPTDWDASEVDVTRLSFAFALTSRDILNRFKLGKYAIDKNEAILGCMKVFMLEHGLEKESVTSTEEVFRDRIVERLMERLLEPYRLGLSTRLDPPAVTDLEKVATRFLANGTPFYQFYSDFIGLYDSISFSHPLFGLLLLPPISMDYAIDYRKLFWSDYPQILRTINVSPNQVLSSNLKEYMYPVEKEPQVIGSLLSALVKHGAKEFLHLVAIHHIAANIWKDLRDSGLDGSFDEERGVKLLKAVVDRGDKETVSQVVKYWQDRGDGGILLPPNCSMAGQDVLETRKGWIERAVGIEYVERLGGLLSTN